MGRLVNLDSECARDAYHGTSHTCNSGKPSKKEGTNLDQDAVSLSQALSRSLRFPSLNDMLVAFNFIRLVCVDLMTLNAAPRVFS